MSKLWGGRFGKDTLEAVERFTASLSIDSRLWQADVRGSIAHARMLGATGIIPPKDAQEIVAGLEVIREDLQAGRLVFDLGAEDVHSEIERLLSEKVGQVAGKLHTARSRNDQVATAGRLYLREEIMGLKADLRTLQSILMRGAEDHLVTLMPGYTHLQHAQPVSLAHHLMAYFWMFERDFGRLEDLSARVNVLPLGSAALAGTSFPVDRNQVARELGFDSVTENSLDAVSDRDFVVEFLSAGALIMTHLSRLCEELILWSTPEFAFVELDDSVTTGSSIMPQKKNPDVAELIRGKTGRLTGALMGALTMLKGLPLSYNRDLQEDKTFLFEGLDTVRDSVRLAGIMLENAKFNAARMKASLTGDFSNATDLADYLVRKGLTFRQSHEIVGKIVRFCIENGQGLEDIQLEDLQKFSHVIEKDALGVLDHSAVMHARTSAGGTAPKAVLEQIHKAKRLLQA